MVARSLRSVALSIAGVFVLPVADVHARSANQIAAQVDLGTGALTMISPSSVPHASLSSPSTSSASRARATVVAGAVSVTDAGGVLHAIANVDRRSWLTWQREVSGVLAFAVRTFDPANPRDDGHDVVRAVDASGVVLWDRVVAGWIPSAFELDGALALASPSALELVDARTKRARCTLSMIDANGWPVDVVLVELTLMLYQTRVKTYAMDPRTCTRVWFAPALTLPVVHAGHVFTSAEVRTSGGGTVTITERDVHTGAVIRTLGPMTYSGFFDQAATRITFAGNTMYLESTFIVLD